MICSLVSHLVQTDEAFVIKLNYVHTHKHTHAHTHTRAHTQKHTHIHTHIRTHIHTHTHTHTRAHTHTCKQQNITSTLMFTIVFSIHCNFLILLSIWLVICRSNKFFFFTRQSVRARKIGHASEVLLERVFPIGIGRAICPGLQSISEKKQICFIL